MDFSKLLIDVNTLAIVCMQWGDTGKGKFVDAFSEWADIIARGTGGANAGHTIKLGDDTHIFHLVPSGILHDSVGKLNIIGSGVAFDPKIFTEEVKIVHDAGMSTDNLFVSHRALLVMPQHILLDQLRESTTLGKIGTTGRGIGPTYGDHYARVGLTVNDLLNTDILAEKIKQNLEEKQRLIQSYDQELVAKLMNQERLGGGKFWNKGFDIDALVEHYSVYGIQIADRIRNTDQVLREAAGKKKIVLEGAQGNLLSVDYGSYPYVTSSDCSIAGLAHGVGLRERQVDLTLGIVKAFYMTRVGAGPFPTELGGEKSEIWCSSANKKKEQTDYPDASVNSTDPLEQGIGIRRAGAEYGATTGRPRRTGWLDLPLLRYSKRFTGNQVILSKLDVLDECDTIRICDSYIYEGPEYIVGETNLKKGDTIETAIPDSKVLAHCVPQYRDFPGWKADITGITDPKELPEKLHTIIKFVEKSADVEAKVLSVGPERNQTIINT